MRIRIATSLPTTSCPLLGEALRWTLVGLVLACGLSVEAGESASTIIEDFNRPLLFSELSWQNKTVTTNGVAVLRGFNNQGGAGLNSEWNLADQAALIPALQLRVGPSNQATALVLRLKDAGEGEGRWEFPWPAAGNALGILLAHTGCVFSRGSAAARTRVAFNTANLVARFTDYRFELKRWGEQHLKTVAQTDEAAWAAPGLGVDTGWFGTQAADVPAQIRAAGKFVRHTHIKDVKAAGAHETCLLGEGVVNVQACLAALRDIGYSGWYSWEDEPEDRNPFDSAVRNRQWIETRLKA